jgi:hypothetical protein
MSIITRLKGDLNPMYKVDMDDIYDILIWVCLGLVAIIYIQSMG